MQENTPTDSEGDSAKRVMIVGTDGTSSTSVARELRSAGQSWDVREVTNHDAALREISERSYKCVVLVYGSEQIVNLELVPSLHRDSVSGACPALIVCDEPNEALRRQARQVGVTTLIPTAAVNASYIELAVSSAVGQWRLMRVIDLLNLQVEEKLERRANLQQQTERFAHEVLTPLASVQEYISLVFDGVSGPVNPEQASHLAYARGGCATIGASVEALVAAAGNHRINTAQEKTLGGAPTLAASLSQGINPEQETTGGRRRK